MPKIDVGANEPLERALRRFKKKIEREGILKVLSAKKHYEKPSEVKRRKERQAKKNSSKRYTR
jgi:small subunit ribosomal protein S21